MYIKNIRSEEIPSTLQSSYYLFCRNGLQRVADHLIRYIDPDENGVQIVLGEEDVDEIDSLMMPFLHMLQQEPMVTFILYGCNSIIKVNEDISDFLSSLRLFVMDDTPDAFLKILSFPVRKECAMKWKTDALVKAVFKKDKKCS